MKAGGNLDANELHVTVADGKSADVTLSAAGEGHLQNALIMGSVTNLTMEGDKSLDLSGVATGSAPAASGSQLTAGTLTLKTDGALNLGETSTKLEATSGALAVNAGTLTLAENSKLKATGALVAIVTKELEAKQGFSAKGSSVSITGGQDRFKFASGSTFTATDGGIDLIASGDLTLGGVLYTNAQSQSGKDTTIRVGTEGVLTVKDDGATITSEKGSVVVVGMKGMDIKHDFTVLTPNPATFYSESGSIKIGNRATVAAGTVVSSDTDSNEYGDVLVEAGENITIGEEATLLSDNLTVTAKKNVEFGSKATLTGLTDGVTVNADEGDIIMGEELAVVSNAGATNFNAGRDIVVGKKSALYSAANDVNLQAGRDVVFGSQFDVYSKKFKMIGSRDVIVGDDVSVETHFTENPGNDPYSTAIVAGRNVTFGDRARFVTTDVNIVAGVVEKAGSSVGGSGHEETGFDYSDYSASGEGGNLAFGKEATMVTKHRGIEVLAVRDITFGDKASFVTYGNFESTGENDYAIDLYSDKGNIRLGNDATIATRKSAPINVLAGNGSVTLGDRAGIGDYNESEDGKQQIPGTSTAYINGVNGVTFGKKAFVWSGAVLIESTNGAITMGDESYLAGARSIKLDARETVRFDGNVALDSINLTDVVSRAGDIIMNISSSVPFDGRVKEAKFTAAGSVIQTGPLGARGISADTLTIVAGKDVLLGIVSTAADTTGAAGSKNTGGNNVGTVNVKAGGDVALTLSSDAATVRVNTDDNGVVNGRLSVKSDGGSITFDQDLSAQSIGVYAGQISAKALTAANELELATAPYDEEGVSISAGKLTGGSVAIRLGKGTMNVPSVTATAGDVSVVRLSNTAHDVVVPTIYAARDVILLNAGGRIMGDKATVGNRAFIIGTSKLGDPGFAQFASKMDTIYLAGAEGVASRWNAEWIRNSSAGDLKAGMLSVTLLSEHGLIDIVRSTDRALAAPEKRRSDEGIRFVADQLHVTGPAGRPSVVEHRVTDFWLDGSTKLLQREAAPEAADVIPLVVNPADEEEKGLAI